MSQKLRRLPPAIRHFRDLADPRIDRQKRHLLLDIIVITICAVICGAEEWTEIALFGKAKEAWFRGFLELPHGIPSHDTFGRVFARLNSQEFGRCFQLWIECVREKTNGELVSIDGKTLRSSFDRAASKGAIHMVSAWSSANSLVLGQVKVDEKSNEITAVPLLLEMLELSGCIVTMDAMGCQKEHVRKIKEKDADYVLALKGNQGHFHQEVVEFFEDSMKVQFDDVPHQFFQGGIEKDHGRLEKRSYWLVTELEWFSKAKGWAGLRGIGMVESERTQDGKTSLERRFFCTSLLDVKAFARAVRGHWGVENGLHWTLDVAFNEDKSRIRKDHAPENLAIMRHIALNLLKQETTLKLGIKAKRLKAGWDEAYLLQVLCA
jgi:predicted transposase YbfD/YdcC